jgi:5-methyltetrahydrofolate--homocysteine methyltransferase
MSPIRVTAPSPSTICAAYGEQARPPDGGADVLIETIFDTLNAIPRSTPSPRNRRRGVDVPIMISAPSPTAPAGCCRTDARGVLHSVRHAAPLSIGLNCALGAEQMRAHVADMARICDTLICTYPNAGLPNEFGHYHESPEDMARHLGEFADSGLVNIVGGCCGTTPGHIGAIAAAVRGKAPRKLPEVKPLLRLAGLEPFTLTPEIPFVNVGERTTSPLGQFRKLRHLRRLRRAGDRPRAGGERRADRRRHRRGLPIRRGDEDLLNLIAAEPDRRCRSW